MIEKVKIIIDEPTTDGKFGFDQYVSSLTSIIMGSEPHFSIGIFGGWGTGKTTLMQMMYEKLKGEDYKDNVVSVWFNAWLYEREQHLAIVPLLSTINKELSECPDSDLENFKGKISKALSYFKKYTKVVINPVLLSSFPMSIEFSQKDEIKDEEDTLYYHKLKQVEVALDEINKKKDLRIVIFIDDLDRCAPHKILEVLESIKIFLGIKGFIYVLGLSRQIIEKCIEEKYKDLGISGSDYIKKIIQIPFNIPEWREDELMDYIDSITEKLEKTYIDLFIGKKGMLINSLEKNPREIKRFINSYIITEEVFKEDKLDKEILLLLQIFQFRWPSFYNEIFNNEKYPNFDNLCKNILNVIENQDLENMGYENFIDLHHEPIKFLKLNESKKIFKSLAHIGRNELERYRRAGLALSGREEELEMIEITHPINGKKVTVPKNRLGMLTYE